MPARPASSAPGLLLALGSAACFALSGSFASALISAGWSPGAATLARIGLSALVLLVPTVIALRGMWATVRRAWKDVLLFGVLAVAGCQLAFFLAVNYISPSLAIVIEFMGPVLLVFATWLRTRVAPAALTFVGAALAVAGLITISGSVFSGGLHPLGILFALVAAVGNAAYYATSASNDHGIPPLPFVGLGMLAGAVVLGVVGACGILPIAFSSDPAQMAGREISPFWILAGLVLISTVVSYLLGVAAARRLGAIVASFAGYSEPLFGIIWPIVLLAILPTGVQLVGAALIIAGVVVVKLGETIPARRALVLRE